MDDISQDDGIIKVVQMVQRIIEGYPLYQRH